MPEELRSFLISVGIILLVALFIPCIEWIVKLVRHNSQQRLQAEAPELKPSKRFKSEAA